MGQVVCLSQGKHYVNVNREDYSNKKISLSDNHFIINQTKSKFSKLHQEDEKTIYIQ